MSNSSCSQLTEHGHGIPARSSLSSAPWTQSRSPMSASPSPSSAASSVTGRKQGGLLRPSSPRPPAPPPPPRVSSRPNRAKSDRKQPQEDTTADWMQ